jgi:hypothetical protein
MVNAPQRHDVLPFRAFAGSVAGLEHRRLGRNNQDAAAVRVTDGAAVAVVADGCSSGASSEVGARLGAAWLAAWLPDVAARTEDPTEWAAAIEARLLRALRVLARSLAHESADLQGVVGEHLLFSFLAGVVARGRAAVLGAGDGVFAIDGETQILDAGEANAPPYVAYALLDGACGAPCPRVSVLWSGHARDVRTVTVCTDGAADLVARAPGELARLAREPLAARNPSLLGKRLRVLAERDRLLFDDTTVAVLARADAEAP